jgi:hypothetical protein
MAAVTRDVFLRHKKMFTTDKRTSYYEDVKSDS